MSDAADRLVDALTSPREVADVSSWAGALRQNLDRDLLSARFGR